jgi:methionyl aminopeptidase
MKIGLASRFVAMFLQELDQVIAAGMSTYDLEELAVTFCTKHNLAPTFKSVPRYKHALCISLNEEVVHGIPSRKKIIKEGDIVSVDFGITLDGYIGDAAYTYMIGKVSPQAEKLCLATKEALRRAIAVMKPGNTLGDIGHAIQSHVESLGFSVVREYVGHGVGFQLHEPPTIYHFGNPGEGLKLEPGMVLAVEPMINEGDWPTEVLSDGWTVVTKDRKLSAQYEHTIAITPNGNRVLTDWWK